MLAEWNDKAYVLNVYNLIFLKNLLLTVIFHGDGVADGEALTTNILEIK
jgi:hypothetical protein